VHSVLSQKFVLRKEMSSFVVLYNRECCPAFGAVGIRVSSSCNANEDNFTHLGINWCGTVDMKDITVDDFFTDTTFFKMKEIEVFKIADETYIQTDVEKRALIQ
jgi:hypothetical protein